MTKPVPEEYLVVVGQAIRGMLPGASWEMDNEGQMIIYTNVFEYEGEYFEGVKDEG
jgi:hypothetical protein